MQSDINYVNMYYPITVWASLKNIKNVKIIEIQ